MQMSFPFPSDLPGIVIPPGYHVYIKVDGGVTIGTERQITAWRNRRRI